eukprot:8594506-Alexandrium_andersonii.AAC.1
MASPVAVSCAHHRSGTATSTRQAVPLQSLDQCTNVWQTQLSAYLASRNSAIAHTTPSGQAHGRAHKRSV